MKTAEDYASIILADLHRDMDAGRVPRDIGSFSALHDIFDANELIIEFMDPDWEQEHPHREGFTEDQIRAAWLKATMIIEDGTGHESTIQVLLDVLDEDYNPHTRNDEEYTKLVNQVLGLVDKALAEEASPDWCLTCGTPVQEGKCGCWCILAGYLQQYLGRGFDDSAGEAAEMWRELAIEDKLWVWRADYAKDHFTYNDAGEQIPIRTYPREEKP